MKIIEAMKRVKMNKEKIATFCANMSYEHETALYGDWHPMTDKVSVKHLGNLNEEAGELVAATARCIIQGVDECEPVTKLPNRRWLENEIADVLAGIELAISQFNLDTSYIVNRKTVKKDYLRRWWHSFA